MVHSVYFKSTDGHMGQWDFNLRRSNLHLIDIISAHGGCIIVDSTRRGKRIPDSLSKTVPIWCCAINRAIAAKYPSRAIDTDFHSLPSVVSRSEHAQIEAKMDAFAQKLISSENIDLDRLAGKLQKPLRPLWFTPQSSLFINDPPDFDALPFWPVICLSASQAVESGCQARPGYLYVQGSGDDQEAWCHGLTPRLFWQHRTMLLESTSAAECLKRVQQLVRDHPSCDQEDAIQEEVSLPYDYIRGTHLAVGSRLSGKPPTCWDTFDVIVNCTLMEYKENKNKRILIHCAKGQDRSVGIALAVLAKYYDLQGEKTLRQVVNKGTIQEHLMRIISSRPKASPSRATLKKINTFFMS
ncbi:tRNA A64-2'-O-ribosylphosphate transferase [Dichotomocladium elegans]|nr:tRNA A64-2'-O-ribosylphosphate transferase [Dichotomocladium elegans]